MTLFDDYASLDDLKAHLRITDAADDAALSMCITAASRAVDQAASRPFGLTGSAVPRIFTWYGDMIDGRPALPVDDFMTTVGLVVAVDSNNDYTYATTLTLNTDFDLYPYNAIADGVPFTHIVLRPTAAATFPCSARGVSITANWGWTTVPSAVEVATLIQAARFFVRRDSPYGIAGSPSDGSEKRLLARLDPDVELSLRAYMKVWAAV